MYIVRDGILGQRDRLPPRQQIWCRSARPWLTELDGIPRNPTQ
jgi:hypothetical protein